MKALVFENYVNNFELINKRLNIEKINYEIIKFKNGEGKVVINDEVNNEDIIVFSDFSFPTLYKYKNEKRSYSKDEYYVELRRVLSALSEAKTISVFLPLVYQSRQNAIKKNESKDYEMFINDLVNLRVKNIITFENHGSDSRIVNYSLNKLFSNKHYDVVVSPDEGGIDRAREYAKVLKCNSFHFSKVRDLSKIIDGGNPIKEYNGEYDFNNKKVLIMDDILDSGKTLIKAINKIDNANAVDVFIAYPLFNNGIKEFKKLVKINKLNKIYVSNLINLDKHIIKNKFIEVIDCTDYINEVLKEVIE